MAVRVLGRSGGSSFRIPRSVRDRIREAWQGPREVPVGVIDGEQRYYPMPTGSYDRGPWPTVPDDWKPNPAEMPRAKDSRPVRLLPVDQLQFRQRREDLDGTKVAKIVRHLLRGGTIDPIEVADQGTQEPKRWLVLDGRHRAAALTILRRSRAPARTSTPQSDYETQRRRFAEEGDVEGVTEADQGEGRWVTINGNHVFIGEKRTDAQAVGPKGNQAIRDVANIYAKDHALAPVETGTRGKLDPEEGRRIADAYDAAKSDAINPEAQRAYAEFNRQVAEQADYLRQAGIKAEPWTKPGQPYANSQAMRDDVMQNGHIWYFRTDEGQPIHALMTPAQNDTFRWVHDVLGHAQGGNDFGPQGEYGAFNEHSKMFYGDALKALPTETLAQNAWFNFSRHNEGRAVKDRNFADQKAVVLPENVWKPHLGAPGNLSRSREAGPPDEPRDDHGRWTDDGGTETKTLKISNGAALLVGLDDGTRYSDIQRTWGRSGVVLTGKHRALIDLVTELNDRATEGPKGYDESPGAKGIARRAVRSARAAGFHPRESAVESAPDEKPTVVLDFDGVIHQHADWKGDTEIPGDPMPGAQAAIADLRKRYRVVVLSARSATFEGKQAVEEWLRKHDIEVDGVSSTKPPAIAYVDDRAVPFAGDWVSVADRVASKEAFREYNPDQPRAPAGSPDGGRWTSGDGADVSLSDRKIAGRDGYEDFRKFAGDRNAQVVEDWWKNWQDHLGLSSARGQINDWRAGREIGPGTAHIVVSETPITSEQYKAGFDALYQWTQSKLADAPPTITLYRGVYGGNFTQAVLAARAKGEQYIQFPLRGATSFTSSSRVADRFSKDFGEGVVVRIAAPKEAILVAAPRGNPRLFAGHQGRDQEYVVMGDSIRVPMKDITVYQGGKRREADHPVDESGKVSKPSVNYMDVWAGDQKCEVCSMFSRPDVCSLVAGSIAPKGHCDEWIPLGQKSALEAFRESLRVPEALRARFREYNPDQARVPAGSPEGGEWTAGEGALQASVDSLGRAQGRQTFLVMAAKKLGYNGVVLYKDTPGSNFAVGDYRFDEAAHYDPRTGDIVIYANTFDGLPQSSVEGVLIHEIEHAKFAVFMRQDEIERQYAYAKDDEVRGSKPNPLGPTSPNILGRDPEHKSPVGLDGYIRQEAKDQFPVAWAAQQAFHTDEGRQKIASEDGVSPYSDAYWKSSVGIERSTDETLAEMARLYAGDTGFKGSQSERAHPTAVKLYNAVEANWKRMHP